jgi:hypothetical protein
MAGQWLHTYAIKDPVTGKYVLTNDDNTPSWEFPSRNGYVPITQNDDIYFRFVEHFNKILAEDADYVVVSEDLSAALPIVATIAAQPDVPRVITYAFASHAQITAFSITFTGVNAKGKTVSETFTQASGWSYRTRNAYSTITSITMTTRTGTGAGDTLNIGIGSILGLSNNLGTVFKVTKSGAATNAVDYSGSGNVTDDGNYDTVDVSTGAAIVDGDSFTINYTNRLYTQL